MQWTWLKKKRLSYIPNLWREWSVFGNNQKVKNKQTANEKRNNAIIFYAGNLLLGLHVLLQS